MKLIIYQSHPIYIYVYMYIRYFIKPRFKFIWLTDIIIVYPKDKNSLSSVVKPTLIIRLESKILSEIFRMFQMKSGIK